MELLATTLLYTSQEKDTDTLSHLHIIVETIRSAPGLVSLHIYRNINQESHTSYYFILTTWQDEESWKRAQERYNPGKLFIESAANLLSSPPEQWTMSYLWGYRRPIALPTIVTLYLTTTHKSQADIVQKEWMKRLQQPQSAYSQLAFAFLAREISYETANKQRTSFFNFLSWTNETERAHCYKSPHHQETGRLLQQLGVVRTFQLRPL